MAGGEEKQLVTREQIIGMQVISSQARIIGSVKNLSLVVGETDQALIIETKDGEEKVVRWSEVAAIGDMVLLREKTGAPPSSAGASSAHCPHCGSRLETGAVFCGNCGKKV
jgi:sporulation protein YlmC with PRC-barrel domain